MPLVSPTDLTLRDPRITLPKFKSILKAHRSPALAEATQIWALLLSVKVDPSFALGQFLVESLYGTAGHAVHTKSWGNILWDKNWTPEQPKYAPGNGYTYAKYASWSDGVSDYVEYVNRYAVTEDYRYHDICETIDKCTARWTGAALDDPGHLRYVSILINAINDEYESVPNTFVEVGDKMIYAGKAAIKTATTYPVKHGTALYRGTDGDLLKYADFKTPTANCRFLGPVGQAWSDAKWAWGAVIVGTSSADPDGTIVYIKNPDKTKVATA